MAEIIKVFVGCASNNEDLESQSVLEWSIRKHASRPVEITWMQQSHDPQSPFYVGPGGWNTQRWATPFSGFRWAVPFLAKGSAIYTDSDVIFMADPAELIDQIESNDVILGRDSVQSRICVSLWNCDAGMDLIGDIKERCQDDMFHGQMMQAIKEHVKPFAGEWNCMDKELKGRSIYDPAIKAIHYTDMRSQPQLRHALPRLREQGQAHWFDGDLHIGKYPQIERLFDELLEEAKQNGYGPEKYIKEPFGPYKKRSFNK